METFFRTSFFFQPGPCTQRKFRHDQVLVSLSLSQNLIKSDFSDQVPRDTFHSPDPGLVWTYRRREKVRATLTSASETGKNEKWNYCAPHCKGLARAAPCQFKFIKDFLSQHKFFVPASGVLKQFANLSISLHMLTFSFFRGRPAIYALMTLSIQRRRCRAFFSFEIRVLRVSYQRRSIVNISSGLGSWWDEMKRLQVKDFGWFLVLEHEKLFKLVWHNYVLARITKALMMTGKMRSN